MKYLFLLSLLLLHGCAVTNSTNLRDNRAEQVDLYLNQEEFSKALALIADTPEDDPQAPQLEKKRRSILADLKKFEQKTVATALKQEQNRNWFEAKQTYKDALQKLYYSQILEAEQASMLQRFQESVNILEFEKLIVTGESLKKSIPLQRRLHENDPDNITIRWAYSQTKTDAQTVALKLLKAGQEMLEKGNLAMAQRLLPLAVELFPDPRTETAAFNLDTILKTKRNNKQKDKRKIEKQQDKLAIETFNIAMALGDFKDARQQIMSLSSPIKKTTPVKLMTERLDEAIGKWVINEVSMGDAFYRTGKYEQAQKVWQNILDVLPQHETVLRKSERTQKIIEKLNTLQERQSGAKQ